MSRDGYEREDGRTSFRCRTRTNGCGHHDHFFEPNSIEPAEVDEPRLDSPFDQIRRTDGQGEWWDARELAKMLGYVEWRNFDASVMKARKSLEVNGINTSGHVVGFNKTSEMPNGGYKEIPSYRLSRHACHLVAQNGDSSKKAIADAQAYFSIQTRRAELQDAGIQKLSRTAEITALMEGQSRLDKRLNVVEQAIAELPNRKEVEGIIAQFCSDLQAAILVGIEKSQQPQKSDLKGRHGKFYGQVLEQFYRFPDGVHCPCCNSPASRWEVDHWSNITNPDRRNGWKVCQSCNQKLGAAGDMSKRAPFEQRFNAFQVKADDLEDFQKGPAVQPTLF